MARFRLAVRQDLPELTTLWQECFGDRPEEIHRFWSALFNKIRVYVATEGDCPVSMLCSLPVNLVDKGGEGHSASYLYAVCTAKKFRGQGLCARLMAYGEQALKREGFSFTCLVPSESPLFAFYEMLGYHTAFYHKSYSILPKKHSAKITKINAGQYQNLRQMQLYGNFVDYGLPLLHWQQILSEANGGGLFQVETSQSIFCAAAEKRDGVLYIKELLPDCEEAASALSAHLNCNRAVIRSAGTDKAFAMVKALTQEELPELSYLGLAFD